MIGVCGLFFFIVGYALVKKDLPTFSRAIAQTIAATLTLLLHYVPRFDIGGIEPLSELW